MASSSIHPANQPNNNIAASPRELSIIASSFVKQYYTILNKAPYFIHNFYSHDSKLIHGTIGMANEQQTEPVVGREEIKNKMDELNLNDCRAKIKQIDCLDTLAGGLVIQVVGELSNNGKPMRRFLQTFVLAPSPDESRPDHNEPQARGPTESRRGANLNENSATAPQPQNQKFFVLNSIFRYQDDGPDSEFEDDAASLNANVSIENSNGGNEVINENNASKIGVASIANKQTNSPSTTTDTATATAALVAGAGEKNDRPGDVGRNGGDTGGYTATDMFRFNSNGTGSADKRVEALEKATENGKPVVGEHQSQTNTSSGVNNVASVSASPSVVAATPATSQPAPTEASAPKPQAYNEPKTYANMVRNSQTPASAISVAHTSVNKNLVTEQQQSQGSNQPSSASSHHPAQQQQQQHHNTPNPQRQQQQQHQTQQQADSQGQNNSQNNNRRRHMVRKPSNKPTGGRPLNKNRPRPTGAAAPATAPATASAAAPPPPAAPIPPQTAAVPGNKKWERGWI